MSSKPAPNSTVARLLGHCARRGSSQRTRLASLSRSTKSTVSAGNLKLTGTATSPARMMPRKLNRNSARFVDRMAMRSPVRRPRFNSPRATALARASNSP
jgi:hypothetical protein